MGTLWWGPPRRRPCGPGRRRRGGQGGEARRRRRGCGAGQAGWPATVPLRRVGLKPPRPLARRFPAHTRTGSSLRGFLLLKGARKLGAVPVPRPPPDCPPPGPRRTSPGRRCCGSAAGTPHDLSMEVPWRSPGPVLCAPTGRLRSGEARNCLWRPRRPNSALRDFTSLYRRLGPAGERKGSPHLFWLERVRIG